MQPTLMTLKILLPFEIFAEKTGVTRIVTATVAGSFGFCRIGSTARRPSRRGF